MSGARSHTRTEKNARKRANQARMLRAARAGRLHLVRTATSEGPKVRPDKEAASDNA